MAIQSPYPNVSFPGRPLTSLILERARSRGDKPAYVDGLTGQALTYERFADRVERIASGLIARGLGQGDVCLLVSPNCIEWPVAYHAVLSAGGVVTTANPMFTARELSKQALDAGASWLIASIHTLEPARAAAREAGITNVAVFGSADEVPDDLIPFADLAESAPASLQVEIETDDLAIVPYSSGTTGYPKGVMLTHRNLTVNLLQAHTIIDASAQDVFAAVIPLAHASGILAFLHIAPYAGLTTVILPRFDLEQFLRTIETHKVTHIIVAPPIVLALAKHPLVENYDLSSLEVVVSAAAPLKEDLARACMARVGCEVLQGYGMTELTTAVSVTPSGCDRPGSAGVLVPNTELKVVDISNGAELGVGETGELWVRGPQIMKGYLNQPDATAEMITVEGWLKTGDIGYVDPDGYIYIVDRLKELIKYNAYQVSPAELEDVLISHPAVVDAAVVGRPDDSAGELPVAYVVVNSPVGADEIRDYVAERVAPYKKVRGVEFVDAIPKSPAGKILRRVLIERERGLVPA